MNNSKAIYILIVACCILFTYSMIATAITNQQSKLIESLQNLNKQISKYSDYQDSVMKKKNEKLDTCSYFITRFAEHIRVCPAYKTK